MKKIITLLFLVVGIISLSPAYIYEWQDAYGYSFWQINENDWYEGYLGFNTLNNGTIIIDGETIAHTGTATYVYVNIDNGAAVWTETGNPAIGSSWTSYTINHDPYPAMQTSVTSSAYHEVSDAQYGNVSCSTAMTRIVKKPW